MTLNSLELRDFVMVTSNFENVIIFVLWSIYLFFYRGKADKIAAKNPVIILNLFLSDFEVIHPHPHSP